MKRSRYMLMPIDRKSAHQLVRDIHRHHGAPVGEISRVAVGLRAGGGTLGVALIGRPVSREIQRKEPLTAEITRHCVEEGNRNLASFLYGAAKRLGFSLGYTKLITYTLVTESGASLKAAGLKIVARVKGRSWDCPSRRRTDKHPTVDKYRWEVMAA